MRKILSIVLAAALLLALSGCSGRTDAGAVVTFFKAGKADAAVIQAQDAVIVIDTGLEKKADELIDSLEDLGVDAVDALILTHFDKDHVGGAAALLAHFGVDAVYQSNYPKDSDEYEAYVEALAACGIEPVTVTDTLTLPLGGLEITIDGPDRAAYSVDPSNNSSLIVTVTGGDTTVLFAGDAENARLAEYLETYERSGGDVILKVPYHGHWQGMLPAFIEAVAPGAAIIPCSKSEPEEDERETTEALLEKAGASVWRTYEGDVTLTLTGSGYELAQAD